jgi:ATP-dependent HslUV protease subunit HslV
VGTKSIAIREIADASRLGRRGGRFGSNQAGASTLALPKVLDFARGCADIAIRMSGASPETWHGTTILTVRKGGKVVIAGDGQVSLGQTIIKGTAKKVRQVGNGRVIAGFAGSTADAFTLFERLETKLERFPDQLKRACVELAKDWRTDRYLRRLEAMMIVADPDESLVLTGTGDVLEPDDAVMGIGSGGPYALAAARALLDGQLDAEQIARKAMAIAAKICVYTNDEVVVETLDASK